jgi:beta-galactosidase
LCNDEEQNSHGFKPLGRRYPETSVGWYRREFEIPASDAGPAHYVEFDGAFRDVIVFVNGCFIGRNNNGYAPFRFDLTDFLAYGAKNYIVARVDASFGDGWFYEGAGIYRHVWLTQDRRAAPGQVGEHGADGGERRLCDADFGNVVENEGKQSESAR